MAKVGFSKNTAADNVRVRQVDHKYVGSPVFEITDPTTKLIHTVGGGFFNEPRYYSTGPNGKTQEGKPNPRDEVNMTEQAREVIDTAKAVLETETPEDLLVIANWVRTDLKIRTTPQVLLAVAAASEKGKPFLRKYMPAVIQRADEIRQVFAAYNHLFNYQPDPRYGVKRIKGLPHALSKGLRDAFMKFRESDFLKYNTKDRPTFGDVALLLREKRRLPKPLFEFLVNGKIVNGEVTPVFATRSRLNSLTEFNAEARELAKKSFATWENLISQFGSKREVWEYLIDAGLIKYMAMLRNLRNFEQAEISDVHWDKVYDKLTKEMGHKQLPFRFLAARRNVTGQHASSAVDIALDNAVQNVPEIPGTTFIMVDSSASMDRKVSEKSQMSYKDAGYALSAILAKKGGRKVTVAAFGTHLKIVPFSAADSTMAIIKGLERAGKKVNCATHAYLALNWLLGKSLSMKGNLYFQWGEPKIFDKLPESPIKVDRIVIVSDMCCYGNRGEYGYEGGENLGLLFDEYRRRVNPDVKYYSVNMAGHGQSQIDPLEKNALLISGWSESIFTLFREFEGLQEASKEKNVEIPSIELLRERFKVE